MKRIIWLVLVVATLAPVAMGAFLFHVASTSVANDALIEVREGDHLRKVLRSDALNLSALDARVHYYLARFGEGAEIKRGSYQVSSGMLVRDVIAMLREGRVRMGSFTLVEGWNRWEVRDYLDTNDWVSASVFDRLCDDQEFLKKLGVPGPTCEGYLLPETYRFAMGSSAHSILSKLISSHLEIYRRVVGEMAAPLSLDHREFTTLASIVEKETGAAQERPRIACVFYNRLTATPRWKLQTDPTVIYSRRLQDPDYDGNIRRSDLRKNPHPYNTYHIVGLPPGPIANPGRAALEAVAAPETCPYFFFVSRNDGTHIFCDTLACHNAAVQKWQINYFRKR